MPVVAVEPKHISDVLRFEQPFYSTDEITVAANSGDWPVGAVLGQVTATEEFKPWDPASNDGSEVASVVAQHLIKDSPIPQKIVANARLTTVVEAELEFKDTITAEQRKAAVKQLKGAGIIAR